MLNTELLAHKDRLVTFEFDGECHTFDEFLRDNANVVAVSGTGPRRMVQYSGTSWHRTTLSELFEAVSENNWGSPLTQKDFTVEEYEQFLSSRLPGFLAAIGTIPDSGPDEQLAWLDRYNKESRGFVSVFVGLGHELAESHREFIKEVESQFRGIWGEVSYTDLFKMAAKTKTNEIKRKMATTAYQRLFLESRNPSQALWELLRLAKNEPGVGSLLASYRTDKTLKMLMKYFMRFPQNMAGERIDLRALRPVEVEFKVGLLDAKYVGPVRFGKKALYDRDRNIYVYGTERLKFRVLQNGGSMRKYGNELVIDKGDIETDLLFIEKVDLLARVNPALLGRITNRQGRTPRVQNEYIVKVASDWTASRELADLCIEELYHIDPDFIRKVYRSQKKVR